ncbi:MAG TPA: dTDP-4-dehydrorhamnose reductase, partial [Ferruginibacter sp.]|nr:dTDP-4-dehydrorhamnose reductase [Ferruginibacter sp.]
TILVTGANGQVGSEFRVLSKSYSQYNFLFVTKDELPIDDVDAVKKYFDINSIQYCVNCAAYTAVDKAETESEKAFLINADAVGNLAAVCKLHNVQFIHISTDYVFDGTATMPYLESNPVKPLGVYGTSKLKGEQLALEKNPDTIIIRTSWVYSSFGNNFVKTMLRLMKERESISVVNDQQGCPTYAADLANVIMQIINKHRTSDIVHQTSIYNYSNSGVINWYQFAVAIKELTNSKCIVNSIPSSQYPTPAKRPQYSVLDTTKIRETFAITIPTWKDSLIKCLALLK